VLIVRWVCRCVRTQEAFFIYLFFHTLLFSLLRCHYFKLYSVKWRIAEDDELDVIWKETFVI